MIHLIIFNTKEGSNKGEQNKNNKTCRKLKKLKLPLSLMGVFNPFKFNVITYMAGFISKENCSDYTNIR